MLAGLLRTRWHVVAALGASASTACEIVDPGPQVGVANRCVVTPSYFVARVVPEYLLQHDCRGRDEGRCHDVDAGTSVFRLHDTAGTLTPAATDPVQSWPEAWQDNFDTTTFQISDCELAELAPLYSKPAGGSTQAHEGGDVFAAGGPELDLIQAWLDGG